MPEKDVGKVTDQTQEALLLFCDALDAAVTQLRRNLDPAAQPKRNDPSRLPFDASKIKWQDRENDKGKFQMSEDFNSLDHKGLLKFLAEHIPSKCVNSKDLEGRTWFYWTYSNGSTIGRKLRRDSGKS